VVKSGGEAGVVAIMATKTAAKASQSRRFKGKRASGGWGRRPQTPYELGSGANGPSRRRQKTHPFTAPARR
jgi:hypothetical protein